MILETDKLQKYGIQSQLCIKKNWISNTIMVLFNF